MLIKVILRIYTLPLLIFIVLKSQWAIYYTIRFYRVCMSQVQLLDCKNRDIHPKKLTVFIRNLQHLLKGKQQTPSGFIL